MMDVDKFLEIIENHTRREILKKLVEGRCYPLLLSRELNLTQQAVMKHLAYLERTYMVRMCGYERNVKGPPRKMYELEGRYTLVVNLTPNIFDIKMQEIPKKKFNVNLRDADKILKEIDKELEEIDKKRLELLALKDYILSMLR